MSGAAATGRRAAVLLALAATAAGVARAEDAPFVPVTAGEPAGAALVARLRAGGLVLFFRHADTQGEPCDRSFRVGDRAGQRNLSPRGRMQAERIGRRLAELDIPIAVPVLAGPVFRARDTAELAFGAARVEVTEALLADDYAGAGRLDQVLAGHRRLFSAPVLAGTNRVLVGHRTPAIMVAGPRLGRRAFPEGAALVVAPGGGGGVGDAAAGEGFRVLGVLMLAPIPGGGFHGC